MVKRKDTPSSSLADQLATLKRDLKAIEWRMLAEQSRYEEIAQRRNDLESAGRHLKAEGIDADGTITWATVCRIKSWQANGNAHDAVKRHDQRLHVLLHQVAFGEACLLDHATYPLS